MEWLLGYMVISTGAVFLVLFPPKGVAIKTNAKHFGAVIIVLVSFGVIIGLASKLEEPLGIESFPRETPLKVLAVDTTGHDYFNLIVTGSGRIRTYGLIKDGFSRIPKAGDVIESHHLSLYRDTIIVK